MTRVFQADWPTLAKLEACVLSGAAAWVIWQRPLLQQHRENWPLLAALALAAFLFCLVAIDRLLLVRRGFAFLSLMAAAAWIGLAVSLLNETTLIRTLLPPNVPVPSRPLIASTVGFAALLVHLSPLRKGIADRGFIALRLRSARHDAMHGAAAGSPPTCVPNPRGRSRLAPSTVRRLSVPAFIIIVATATLRFGLPAILYEIWTKNYSVFRNGDLPASRVPEKTDSTITADANGASIPLAFDANVSFLVLTGEDAERLGIATRPSRHDTYTKIGDRYFAVAGAILPTVSIHSSQFTNLYVYVAQPGALSESRYGPTIAAATSMR